LPGAVAAVARLRAAGLPLRVITSTTAKSRGDIGCALPRHGFDFADDDLLTASIMAATYLRSERPDARVFLLGDARPVDLEGVRLVGPGDEPQVILVSGADESSAFVTLNRAYQALLDGAVLVAMHRSLSWMTPGRELLDAGA
jgi:ribonucleotide monophosphatase NagD (HAD superfamily)